MNYNESRIKAVRNSLDEGGFSAIYITNLTNVRYLSGFKGSAGSCFISDKVAYFISDGRYAAQSKGQVHDMEIIISNRPHIEILVSKGIISGTQKIEFEADELSVNSLKQLKLIASQCQWVETTQLVEKIAMVKDKSEISAMRTAVQITDAVFEQIIPEVRPGATEKEIAAKIPFACKMMGAECESFPPIIASGENSAFPHAKPTERKIEVGDFVVLDFGAKYDGYHADMTRTIVVGNATDKHSEVYDVVYEAQKLGCEATIDGIACKEIDSVCRNHINNKGYGEFFNHSTGHGLGLEIHTNPRFSPLSNDKVFENYIMTIEPGIYLPSFGGVRIEDDVLVKKDGCEILNNSPKELLELN